MAQTSASAKQRLPRDTASAALYDVVVVGAGPAGSSAARSAAEAGLSVLILDQSRFPRYKTCGGGLMGLTARLRARVKRLSTGAAHPHYSHPPLRFSTGRIRMNASTAWIWPS